MIKYFDPEFQVNFVKNLFKDPRDSNGNAGFKMRT